MGKEGDEQCSVTAEGMPQKFKRANISRECAGTLSRAASSVILAPCSARHVSDSSYLMAGPKDQALLFQTLLQNSWHGAPAAGSKPLDGVAGINTWPSLHLSSLAQ